MATVVSRLPTAALVVSPSLAPVRKVMATMRTTTTTMMMMIAKEDAVLISETPYVRRRNAAQRPGKFNLPAHSRPHKAVRPVWSTFVSFPFLHLFSSTSTSLLNKAIVGTAGPQTSTAKHRTACSSSAPRATPTRYRGAPTHRRSPGHLWAGSSWAGRASTRARRRATVSNSLGSYFTPVYCVSGAYISLCQEEEQLLLLGHNLELLDHC